MRGYQSLRVPGVNCVGPCAYLDSANWRQALSCQTCASYWMMSSVLASARRVSSLNATTSWRAGAGPRLVC